MLLLEIYLGEGITGVKVGIWIVMSIPFVIMISCAVEQYLHEHKNRR